MERYSEYKDSGVKWLGEIPSHWEVMPLKSFIKFEKGKTPKEFSDENIGLPYLTMDYLRSRDNKIVKYPTTSSLAASRQLPLNLWRKTSVPPR